MKDISAKWLLLLFLLSLSVTASAERIRGVVVDSLSNEPVAFAAVHLDGTTQGTLADADGKFQIQTSFPFSGLTCSSMGFRTKTVPRLKSGQRYTVSLVPTGVGLSELTVRPGKRKYSKKDNPALELMRKIRNAQKQNDPRRNAYYNYDKYERITLGLSNVDESNAIVNQFPDLVQYMDTSVLSGQQVLNLAVREKASHVDFRNEPQSEKETVIGMRRDGIDEILDPQATQILYEDVLREVDIYGDNVTIMQNRFVSPLARIAPDYYRFYLHDTVTVGTDSCIVLAFAPHIARGFGFVGKLFVSKNDSTHLVRRIEMNTPPDINLNFIKNLRIVQEYDRAADGSRLKTLDEMTVEAGVLAKNSQLYARRLTSHSGHTFSQAPDPKIFDRMADVITLPQSADRSEEFWQSRRNSTISAGEKSVGRMMADLRRNKVYYWAEKVLKVIVTGYVNTSAHSKWDFGPVNTLVSYNGLEGIRFRVGGMSTANLSKRFFTRDYVAYGLRDRKWKYLTEMEYSFRDKAYHSREFPMHALRFTHLYDGDMLGQHYLFTNPDNIFLSLKREKDRLMTYRRLTKLEYILELENNFSLMAKAEHQRQEESRWIKFIDGYGRRFGHLTSSTFELTLRYAPSEKFYQTKSNRLPVNLDAPVFQLSHRFGPKGFAGNRFAVSVTELSFQKRFWLSAFGYFDAIVRSGHVWTRSTFLNLLIPNANLSYTIQPESFALMQPLEFINDSYASWDVTYWMNGALFNLIPWFNRLKLREVVTFRGIWGHLSRKNRPDLDPELFCFPSEGSTRLMTGTPYMELSAGIDNLFRILRVDYVWRLSYRDTPKAPNGGVRIALHFTF